MADGDRKNVAEIRLLVSEKEIKEAFEWVPNMERIKQLNKEGKMGKFYAVKALHEGVTDPHNIGHGPRKYTEEELMMAARTLIGRLLNINHKDALKSGNNLVVDAEWNAKEKCTEAIVYIEDPWAQQEIANGNIKFVSVQGPPPRAAQMLNDGTLIPSGIFFDGLALVTKENLPGDPKSSIRLIEINEADYPWDQCINDMQAQGHSADSANKICSAIKNRTVQHILRYGLAKSATEAARLISEKCKNDPLFMCTISKIAELGEQIQELRKSSLNRNNSSSSRMPIDSNSIKVFENLDAFLAALETIGDMPPEIKMQLASLAKQLYGQVGEIKKLAESLGRVPANLNDQLQQIGKILEDIKNLGSGQQDLLKQINELRTNTRPAHPPATQETLSEGAKKVALQMAVRNTPLKDVIAIVEGTQ